MRRPSKEAPADRGLNVTTLKPGTVAPTSRLLSADTKRRPSLHAPSSRTGSVADLTATDHNLAEKAHPTLNSLPENLGAAFQRSLSNTGSSAMLAQQMSSPRSSLTSTKEQSSLKDSGRRVHIGGVSDSLFPRQVHHPSSSSGSRLSVIQVQAPPAHDRRASGSGARQSVSGSVGPDGHEATRQSVSSHPMCSEVSAAESGARASCVTTSSTSKSCKSLAGEAQRQQAKESREVQTPPVAPAPAPPGPPQARLGWSRGSCSTVSDGAVAQNSDSEASPRYLSGTARSSGSTPPKPSPRLPWLHALRRKAAPYCRSLGKNKFFQVTMFGALLSALFLPDLWVILDRPTNNDLDVILSCVLLLFLVELVVRSIGLTRTYWGSFFFWMDLLGAVSLLLDLSYLPLGATSSLGESGSNVVILRAARMAKLGARAGRFTRLAKLLRFLPFMQDMQGLDQGTAKVMSARLITSLSMRVSGLIIVMVVAMPLFSMWTYPGQDWSMESWLGILDVASSQYPDSFHEQLLRFGAFYDDMGYYPYRLSAKSGAALPAAVAAMLPWEPPRGPPQRAANSVRHEGESLTCEFNFKKPNQIDSLMNILLLILIMILMVGWSLMLSNFVSAQVLRPLEKLLLQVRRMASRIFQSVTDMTVTMGPPSTGGTEERDGEGEEDSPSVFGSETDLLEKVVAKLAVLSQIAMSKNAMDPEAMEDLGAADRAVIRGYQGHGLVVRHSVVHAEIDEEFDPDACRVAQKAMVENAGLSLDIIDSDNMNPLELDRARNQAAATYFLSQLHHGMPFDAVILQHFLEAVEMGYLKSSPYHNWYHAVDVAHCVHRLLRLCGTEQYLSSTERFGLLVSSLCHDIGHPGVNNNFLVDTAHDLALRYNDKSPLENMHCARLFELVSVAKCNIFALLSKHQFQDIRKICIEVILHTDNAQHFVMIKDVQMFYEVHSELFDAVREANKYISVFMLAPDAQDHFAQPDSRKLMAKLFLHFADISNCMKPFRICRIWAMKIMEEFFMQGDLEKKMGVPVQALNDREKVNRAFSQVGFIEFLVSPLMFVAIRVMIPLESYGEQMLSNVKKWHQIWLAETKPEPTEVEQKAVAERIAKLSSKLLATQS